MKWIILLALTLNAHSIDLDLLKRKGHKIYQIENDDSFDDIVKKAYEKSNFKHLTVSDFKDLLQDWNPHLRSISNYSGQYIYISYPYSPNLPYGWAQDLSQPEAVAVNRVRYDPFDAAMGKRTPQINISKRSPASSSKAVAKPKEESKIFNFAHVTISQGEFSDSIGENKINSQQNSPFTIGTGLVYLPESMPSYSIASSIYYSKLTASSITEETGTIENTNVDIPAEIGANLYLQKNYGGRFSALYGGLDYEQFNTYNFAQIINGETNRLATKQQKINYLTLGVGFNLELFQPITVKISGSQGLTSATDLDGRKFMFYFNQKISKSFWYHFLIKTHMLSGDDQETTITRYGFGVGTSF